MPVLILCLSRRDSQSYMGLEKKGHSQNFQNSNYSKYTSTDHEDWAFLIPIPDDSDDKYLNIY